MKDILKKGSDLELEAINHEGQNGRSEFAWEAVLGDFSLGDIENEKNELIDVLTDRKSTKKLLQLLGLVELAKLHWHGKFMRIITQEMLSVLLYG